MLPSDGEGIGKTVPGKYVEPVVLVGLLELVGLELELVGLGFKMAGFDLKTGGLGLMMVGVMMVPLELKSVDRA